MKNAKAKKVPSDWEKISATKAVSRFHTPEIMALLDKLNQHREQLNINAERAWVAYLDEFSEHYDECRKVVMVLASIDCLFSLANVATQQDYVRPSITDDTHVQISNGRHPIVSVLLSDEQFVPNDCKLDVSGPVSLNLTFCSRPVNV